MKLYLVLTSLVTGIIATAIIIAANFAVKPNLDTGDIITAASIGLSCGVGIFFLFRNSKIKSCRQANDQSTKLRP